LRVASSLDTEGRSLWSVIGISLALLVATVSASFASILLTRQDAKSFCVAIEEGESMTQFEQRVGRTRFQVFPFKSRDGVLLVMTPSLFPFTSFCCDVRYAGDQVRSASYFTD